MRRGFLILAFISLCPLARAADCFTGTWKLDTEKSYVDSSYVAPGPRFRADLKLKRGSATFTRERNGYTFEISAEFNDGQYWHIAAPVTFNEHAYEGMLDGKRIVFTSRRLGDHSFKVLTANEQTVKVTEVFLFNVSSDDTTLVLTDLRQGERSPSLTMVFNKR